MACSETTCTTIQAPPPGTINVIIENETNALVGYLVQMFDKEQDKFRIAKTDPYGAILGWCVESESDNGTHRCPDGWHWNGHMCVPD